MGKALETLLNIPARDENPFVQEAKANGKPVIGYMCGYVPDEIIYAGNMLPYRLEASGEEHTELGEAYVYKFFCTFTTSLLHLALTGGYDFLDGVCFLNGCDQLRRIIGIWQDKVKGPMQQYIGMIAVPHRYSEEGFQWYIEEITRFKEDIKGYFGIRINEDDLRNAIKVYNESRRLIDQLNGFRQGDEIRITGSETFKIIDAAFKMPRDQYNTLLAEALEELRQREPIRDYRAKVVVGGSVCDDPAFVELVESRGCLVVGDTLCTGSRHFASLVDEEGDPMTALARRYMFHNPCPRMAGEYQLRLDQLMQEVKVSGADGVILQKLGFCDNHGVEGNILNKDLEAAGIPTLRVDRQHTLTDVGRYTTRIDAFCERLEGGI